MSSTTLERAAEDADLRASRQEARRERLESRFREIADGMPWYDGTGNDDKIFPHQWTAMCFGAVARRWFLGDEPGMGKTRTSIGWLDLVGAEKVILVAEANVAAQFAGEVMELAPHRKIIVLAGSDSNTRKTRSQALLTFYRQAVVVINYEIFRRDKESLSNLLKWQADSIIVDEAHNMKTIKTSNFRIIQKLVFTDNTCERCGGLIFTLTKPCRRCGYHREHETVNEQRSELEHYLATKSIKNVCLMTGTPMLNTPVDLYSIFHLIDPSKFPTQGQFIKTFLKPSYVEGSRKHVFKRNGLKQLHPYIKNFFLQRTLEDVGIELPKQHIRVIRVDLDETKYPLQVRTIEQVSKQAKIILTSGEKMTLMHMISIILRKRQANVWPGGIEMKDTETGEVIFSVGKEVQESVKMDAATEQILAYHALGKRQVVFSQFRGALREFGRRLSEQGLRVAHLDGLTKERDRTAIKNNFYKAKGEVPKWDVVLVHYRTGGAGLNLTSTTVTHILDEEWNAGRRDQAYARNHRLGQDEETEVLIYRIPGTVDTWMARLIQSKENMVKQLRETMAAPELTKKITDAILNGDM